VEEVAMTNGMTKREPLFGAVLAMGFGVVLATGALGCGGAAPPPAQDAKSATTAGDADGDGVPDDADKCPDKKEDGQMPDPKDGCPKT
jgi:hypothetical protein